MALPTTNLTARWDASTTALVYSTHTTGVAPTGTPASGGAVASVASAVTATHLLDLGSTNPTWQNDNVLTLPSLKFANANDSLCTLDYSKTNILASSFLSASAYTILLSFYLDTTTVPNNATVYQNMTLLADVGQFMGLFLKKPSGYELHAYNWDGNADSVSVPIGYQTKHVAMVRHQSGSLYLSIDGGVEVSVASGSTTNLASRLAIGKRLAGTETNFTGRIGEIATYNVALGGTDLSDAISYFTAKWLSGGGAVSTIDLDRVLRGVSRGVLRGAR
jgi:hypothetical protein